MMDSSPPERARQTHRTTTKLDRAIRLLADNDLLKACLFVCVLFAFFKRKIARYPKLAGEYFRSLSANAWYPWQRKS